MMLNMCLCLKARILIYFSWLFQFCALLLLGHQGTAAGEPLIFRPDSHRLTVQTSYYDSKANFDPVDGTFVGLDSGKYLRALGVGVKWDQISSKRSAWRFGLNAVQAESFDGSFVRKRSAVSDVFLGYQFFWIAKPIKLKPEFIVNVPVESVDPATDEVLLGDGVTVAHAGMWAQAKWLSLDHTAYLGAAYRTGGLSSLVEFSIGSKKEFEGFDIGAEVVGFESVTDDEFTATPAQRTTVTNRVNAGSLKYYAVNPSLISANVFFGLQMTEALGFRLGYGMDVQGKNFGKGSTIYLNLEWDLSTTGDEFTKSRRQGQQAADVDKFTVEATEYDENLFREEKPKPMRSKNKKPKKSVDQLINEAEDSLEK